MTIATDEGAGGGEQRRRERIVNHTRLVERYFEAYNKAPERGYIDPSWAPKGFSDTYHLIIPGTWDIWSTAKERSERGDVATAEMRMLWKSAPDLRVVPFRQASGFVSVEPGDFGLFADDFGVAAWIRWQAHDRDGKENVFHEVSFYYTDEAGRIEEWLSFADFSEPRGMGDAFGGNRSWEELSFSDYVGSMDEQDFAPVYAARSPMPPLESDAGPPDPKRVAMHRRMIDGYFTAYARAPERGYVDTDWAPNGFADPFHRVIVGSKRDEMIPAARFDRQWATAEMELLWQALPDLRPVPHRSAEGFSSIGPGDYPSIATENGAAAWSRWLGHDSEGQAYVFHVEDFIYTDEQGRVIEWLSFVNHAENPELARSIFGGPFEELPLEAFRYQVARYLR
jgi:hypothetical protein